MKYDFWFENLILYDLLETLLPDFILAFALFTSLSYLALSKQFSQQRPVITVSAVFGLALALGLVWWEHTREYSLKNLGPLAIGFALVLLGLVIYQVIRQMSNSWAGTGIALAVAVFIAWTFGLNLPLRPEILQTAVTVALMLGVLAFIIHHKPFHATLTQSDNRNVRRNMSQLYRDRNLSGQLERNFRHLRKDSDLLHKHPEKASDVLTQLKRMLPAEGYLTQRMAQLRSKAYQIRKGHIARLAETKDLFTKLPASAKKQAAAELTAGYHKLAIMDTRLARLDQAVAENERRIRQLTQNAQKYTTAYDYPKLYETLKAAEKLQHHNSKIFKQIEQTESRLSGLVRKVTQKADKINKS